MPGADQLQNRGVARLHTAKIQNDIWPSFQGAGEELAELFGVSYAPLPTENERAFFSDHNEPIGEVPGFQ